MSLDRFFRLIPLTAISILAAGCGESVTSPSGQAPFSQTEVRLGTGSDATSGKVLTVHYTGWLYDGSEPTLKGQQFDSSAGGTPFSFLLGAGQVIAGWDQGLVGMKVSGIRRLVIPPSLAYGGARSGVIPANATLVFDVELLAVQ